MARALVGGIAITSGARSATLDEVEIDFITGEDGTIEARLGEEHVLLNHALEDISSRAPRGAKSRLSTYWIDRAERGLRAALESGSPEPFSSGNATYLRLEGDQVIANWDFEPDEQDAESIGVDDFLSILERWRRAVIEAGRASGAGAEPSIRPRPMRPPSAPPPLPFPPVQ